LPVGGANRGTDTIFGPGDRTFDTSEQTQRPVEWSNRAAAPTYGDRHDVRYTDWERSTSNVQLSTFNGVTGRAHGGLDMGTDTVFCRSAVQIEGQTQHLARGGRTFDLLDLSKRRSGGRGCPGAPGFGDRHDVWGPAEQIEGQTRCPVYRSGTLNVVEVGTSVALRPPLTDPGGRYSRTGLFMSIRSRIRPPAGPRSQKNPTTLGRISVPAGKTAVSVGLLG